MIVGSTTSTRFEHLLQLTSTAFQIHVKRNLLNDPSQNHETSSEPLQIPNQGGRISTPFELRNLNSNNVSAAVMSFGNLEKVKNLYSWNRDVTTQLINSTQFENLQQVVDALSNSSTVQRVNLVIPFELKYLQNRAILPVRELTNPVTMEIRIPKQAHELMTQIIESSSNYRIVCMYWNETKLSWESNGCLTELLNTSTVTCQCNHTTTFTAFVEVNNLLNQVDLAITIAQIIVSSLLIIVISAFLLLFILTSQKNPMKSRWILPFFALASLIVELIFSFIVPNAISLSGSDRSVLSAGNIVKQVSAMISVTFFALALLNYVVLVVRYLLFRYMYEIMELFAKLVHDKEVIMNRNVSSSNMNFDPSQDFENNQPKWFWLLKRMASKGVQIMVNIVLAIIIIGYFVIFISLVGTSSIASTSYTKVMAGSLLGYVLVISLIVIIVFVLDAVFESRFTQMTDETKLTLSKKNSEMDFKTQESQKQLIESFLNGIKNYFTTNDALSFRAEFIYYMTGVACFVISYSLGLWFIDQPTRNGRAEQGVQLAFDVLSVLFFIAAFGGHVSIVTAVNYMKSKRMKGYRNVETSVDSEDDMSEELREILTQPSLCKIFEQYAKLEFSLENIIFWKKLDRMKQLLNQSINNQHDSTNSKTISSWELLEKEFSQWKVDHMDANASMEINFPSHIKHKFNAIHTQLQKQEPSALPSQQLIQELFQDMHSDLILNLSDTFSRFMFTESYEKIMTFMQLKKEMNASFDDTQQNNSSKSIL
ncbi:hypothetical protein C9374_007572 [Naegleria lovaniensis]|uniref:RGS domain-containing protein n=1 Tax=Naegleria lovaniensis TaxID=51637 RepID=A0AA88GK08_NAELO|nr:uncharacterized protein C9374_007572 [Naegleria lovaniensis]KAG2378934.1 hypothetical protein C9374_007572 [Naegleria lovaniensis]